MGLFMSLILLDCGLEKEIKLSAQHICVMNSIMKSKVVQNMINVLKVCSRFNASPFYMSPVSVTIVFPGLEKLKFQHKKLLRSLFRL